MSSKIASIVVETHVCLNSKELVELGRLKKSAFTRQRKLGFCNLIGMLLNFGTRTLQSELYSFFDHVLKKADDVVTKQAFSKARKNLNPEVFRYLSDNLVKTFYRDDEFDRILDYRILAVDGTTIELPNLKELKDVFGHIGDVNETVRAKASVLFDIENQVTITSEIDHYRIDERTLAKRHLLKLKKFGYKNDLLLYDRGYPSRELIAYHYKENLQFIMRSKDNFLDKKRVYREERDEIITFEYDNKEYSVRRVQFMLSSGEVETLVTSLMDVSIEVLKKLYYCRWNIETNYNVLKNVLQIENLSGNSPNVIRQDFYATIYLNNISAGFLYDEKQLNKAKNNSTKKPALKYDYKINRNEMACILKDKLITAIMMKNSDDRVKLFNLIMKRMRKNMVPIRPNRNPPRKKSQSKGIKYPQNKRKSI